jgi:hypothetical protein
MNRQGWEEICSLCQQSRWWVSASGYRVCWTCTEGDPLTALIILARRRSAEAVQQVQRWVESVADA